MLTIKWMLVMLFGIGFVAGMKVGNGIMSDDEMLHLTDNTADLEVLSSQRQGWGTSPPTTAGAVKAGQCCFPNSPLCTPGALCCNANGDAYARANDCSRYSGARGCKWLEDETCVVAAPTATAGTCCSYLSKSCDVGAVCCSATGEQFTTATTCTKWGNPLGCWWTAKASGGVCSILPDETAVPTAAPTRPLPTAAPTARPTTGQDIIEAITGAPAAYPNDTPAVTGCKKCNHDPKATQPVITSNLDRLIAPRPGVKVVDYGFFKLWMDCARKGAFRFQYNALRDCGCEARVESFYIDTNKTRVPRECEMNSGAAMGKLYDRGHQVPANHMDYSAEAIKASNFVTNILPQAWQLNRGAWLLSEEIIECYRDVENLFVVGGAVWPKTKTPASMVLFQQFGVQIPSFQWKVVRATTLFPEDNGIIAWWMPNCATATRDTIDSYLVSIAELEQKLADANLVSDALGSFTALKEVFDLPANVKARRPRTSWAKPEGCDVSR